MARKVQGPAPNDLHVLSTVRRVASVGLKEDAIAAAIGIHVNTWRQWKRKGREGVPEYVAIWKTYLEAQEGAQASLLASIIRAGQDPKRWQAHAWLLERRFGYTVQNANDLPIGDEEGRGPKTKEELVEALAQIPIGVLQAAIATIQRGAAEPQVEQTETPLPTEVEE